MRHLSQEDQRNTGRKPEGRIMQIIKRIAGIVAVFTIIIVLGGCQWGTRQFGGNTTIDVPCDQKIFDVTWKDSDIWYATHPMREDEEPEVSTFHESSVLSIAEGTVTFKESRCK